MKKKLPIEEKCKQNIKWFVETFCRFYDPRQKNTCREVVLEKRQKRALIAMRDSYGLDDLTIRKLERNVGASWLAACVVLHRMLFFDNTSTLVVYKMERWVDNFRCVSETSSFFGKLDYLTDHLPQWMYIPGGWDRTRCSISETINGFARCKVRGCGATGDCREMRGSRYDCVVIDDADCIKNLSAVLETVHHMTNSVFIITRAEAGQPKDTSGIEVRIG